MKTVNDIYADHAERPYIAPAYEEELRLKPIAKRQMERTPEGLLPGHVIMLWRIQFGSYLTTSPHHKYFATTYGIDAPKELAWLMAEGYVSLEDLRPALRHVASPQLKSWLKERGVKGLSKMKRAELDQAVLRTFTDQELAERYQVRAYLLTPKGQDTLNRHPEIVAKHPQKKF